MGFKPTCGRLRAIGTPLRHRGEQAQHQAAIRSLDISGEGGLPNTPSLLKALPSKIEVVVHTRHFCVAF